MDNIKVTFKNVLEANADYLALVSTRTYPKHLKSITNPTFPCTTIAFEKIMTDGNEISEDGYYIFDVWSKKGNDELTAIYSLIKKLINKKRNLGGGIVYVKQYHANDDLYEEDTKTYHLCAKFKVTVLDTAIN